MAKIAAAVDSDAIRETLTNKDTLKDLLKDPETMVEWINDSVQARIKSDPGVVDQLREQTEQTLIAFLRDQGAGSEAEKVAKRLNMDGTTTNRTRMRSGTVYNKGAVGAKHDDKFKSTTEFLYSISNHAHRDAGLAAKLHELKNDLSSMKPSDGGFLIPEILRAELLRVALEKAVVRSRARVIPMDSLTVPFPTVDSTSNVSSVFGGITGFWTEEGATLTESQPRFGRVELRAQKLVLYTEVPSELIQDSRPSITAFIEEIFPEAIAWFEDVAFFIGSGTGEPLGFLNAPCAVSATRTPSGAAIEWPDIVNMYARMLPQGLDRAVWIVSPDSLPALFQMTLTGGTSPVMLGNTGTFTNSGSVSPPMSMLGMPIIVSEKARQVGTSGDINLVDFGYYLLGDRQAMSAKQSEEFRFQNDLTAFRVTERLDGRPWLPQAITPQNGGATLSPFVKLS
jgi:HK97 family phage major capsid protein